MLLSNKIAASFSVTHRLQKNSFVENTDFTVMASLKLFLKNCKTMSMIETTCSFTAICTVGLYPLYEWKLDYVEIVSSYFHADFLGIQESDVQ